MKKTKIVVVEDDSKHRMDAGEVFSCVTKYNPVEFSYASNLEEAVLMLKKNPDGLITDLYFPEKEGLEPSPRNCSRLLNMVAKTTGRRPGTKRDEEYMPLLKIKEQNSPNRIIPVTICTSTYHHHKAGHYLGSLTSMYQGGIGDDGDIIHTVKSMDVEKGEISDQGFAQKKHWGGAYIMLAASLSGDEDLIYETNLGAIYVARTIANNCVPDDIKNGAVCVGDGSEKMNELDYYNQLLDSIPLVKGWREFMKLD